VIELLVNSRRNGISEKARGKKPDVKNFVFAGQMFAEMLACICHEEFYNQSYQEVLPPLSPSVPLFLPPSALNSFNGSLSRFSSRTLHSNCTVVVVFSVYLEFRKHIMALVRVLSVLEGSEEIKPSFQYCQNTNSPYIWHPRRDNLI
jgi:hypothetical protein